MKSLIIDPGHGGSDPGTSGFGVLEKDWNLKMSIYQYERLKELGAKVSLTRNKDITLSNNTRTALVTNKYNYCMSNHFNGYDGTAHGIETIHSIFAKKTIAKQIGKAIKKTSGLRFRRAFSKRGANGRDYYYMHRLTGNTKTIIVEYGFIDNKKDHAFYKVESNFYKVAETVVKEWCQILGVVYLPPVKEKQKGLYKVQVGAFENKVNAMELANELRDKGYPVYVTQQ